MSDSLAYTDPAISFSAAFLTCEWGSELHTGRNLSRMPIRWTTTHKICDPGEVCEETLLLVEAGAWAAAEGESGLPSLPALGQVPQLPAWFPSRSGLPSSFRAWVPPSGNGAK